MLKESLIIKSFSTRNIVGVLHLEEAYFYLKKDIIEKTKVLHN